MSDLIGGLICILLIVIFLVLLILIYKISGKDKVSKYQKTIDDMQVERIESIEKRLSAMIDNNMRNNNLAIQSVIEQVAKVDSGQNQLKELSKDLVSLQEILNDKKSRGVYAEVELYGALNAIFADNQQIYQKQYRLKNGYIVDCAIMNVLEDKIVGIDAKFPLENYNRIHESQNTKAQSEQARAQFKKDLLKHINDIHNKYIVKDETSPLAFMFVPSETIVNYIYNNFDDIVQYSYKANVFIVSLTTLMAYMTIIKSLYIDHYKSLKTQEIQVEYDKLATEFNRFVERYYTILKDFDKITQDIRNTDITIRKLKNQFDRIQEVELHEKL